MPKRKLDDDSAKDGAGITTRRSKRMKSNNVNNDTFPFVNTTCSKKFTGEKPHQQHLNSAEHLKKLQKQPKIEKNCSEKRVDGAFPFACETCDKKFNGVQSYKQHLASALHLKKARNYLEDTFPFACDTCDKKFNGIKPYYQHLASELHLRKAFAEILIEIELPECEVTLSGPIPYQQQLDGIVKILREILGEATESSISATDADLQFPFSCLVCDKKFTGEIPYKEHLESAAHVKKANLDPNEVFSCAECEVTLSGPIPYQQHLDGIKHAIAIAGPGKASVVKVRRQLEYFKGGHRPEDIRCCRVDEPLGEEMFPSPWIRDEAQERADGEFLDLLGG